MNLLMYIPVKTNSTVWLALINIGVKEPELDKVKEFKFIVQEDDTIIFLSSKEPVISNGPLPVNVAMVLSEFNVYLFQLSQKIWL